jgi:phosphoribosylaminoimidazolecarboxamide formyltransferase/IMP cyclohydrolase
MPSNEIKIRNALISLYHKEGLAETVRALHAHGVVIYSTGGTQRTIESLTGFPSILGGRVKTLHPHVFGGILRRSREPGDLDTLQDLQIPAFDLVVVDLYPFEETLRSGASHEDIIEKIDIGGISLIRAAAKNYADVLVIPSREDYALLKAIAQRPACASTLEERRTQAARAFAVSSAYDAAIGGYLGAPANATGGRVPLRYGENPHQQGYFNGRLDAVFEQLHGKALSYNNLLDIDAAVALSSDFGPHTCAVIKHCNPCGLATRESALAAWQEALAGDPVSAFGGIIIFNTPVDEAVAAEVNALFFEVLLAPAFTEGALAILKSRKNRILLRLKDTSLSRWQVRTVLNGTLEQERDLVCETDRDLKCVTQRAPADEERADLLFANKIVKHSKSNAIVLAKGGQLLGSGAGHTSRVDALRYAIDKAARQGFDLSGAVMASDAFFPFPDCVEIAHESGITAVIQPGGSVKDQASIDYCDQQGMAMVFTGIRHFRH